MSLADCLLDSTLHNSLIPLDKPKITYGVTYKISTYTKLIFLPSKKHKKNDWTCQIIAKLSKI